VGGNILLWWLLVQKWPKRNTSAPSYLGLAEKGRSERGREEWEEERED